MSLLLKKFSDMFEYNSSTLSGSLDVIVVEQKDHTLESTPFHVRVGKFKALNTKLKKINIFINGVDSKYTMKLNRDGIGFFETEVNNNTFSENENDQSSAWYQSDEEQFNNNEENTPEKPIFDKNTSQSFQTNQENPKIILNSDASNDLQLKTPKSSRKLSDYKIKDDFEMKNIPGVKQNHLQTKPFNDESSNIQLSFCGQYLSKQMSTSEVNVIFDQHLISFKKFDANPHEILQNDNLMIRIGNNIYDSYFGLPQLLSKTVFQQELSQYSISNMKQRLTEMDIDNKEHPNSQLPSKTKKMMKSLKPPADFWKNFDLKEGVNILQYRFKGNLDSEQMLEARVFYYRYNQKFKIIVSDIDGTITKSDILGHIMPFIYRDWSQKGIAEFYTNLVKNGYTIVYLTARNIGQAHKTLHYLKSVNQKGVVLPEGPMITSPDTFYESIKREVIIKNPEIFKIKVLRQIKKVFAGTSDYNPFYCGFGNKDTDAIAYAVVGISKKRIFTINPDGDIFMLKSGVITSYIDLNKNIDQIFPFVQNTEQNSEESDVISRGESFDKMGV